MAGSKTSRIIAWDSCLFLAWFNQEMDKPLDAMARILDDVKRGRLTMVVSAICLAEVLDETDKSDAGQKMIQFTKRSNVIAAAADFRIAERAAKFRQRAKEITAGKKNEKSIKAPDALIAATAVVYSASELHSFDPILLRFSNTAVLDNLIVDDISDDQPRLFSK